MVLHQRVVDRAKVPLLQGRPMAETVPELTLPLPRFDKPVKLLIVVALTYKTTTDRLVAGALATCKDGGVEADVVQVPGLLELPTAIGISERMAKFDGYVALGCAPRDHDGTCQAQICATGISLLGLQGLCIGNGLVVVDPAGQAADAGKIGGQAAAAALHLIALSRKWASMPKGIGFRP